MIERREFAYFTKQAIYSPNILFIRIEDANKWGFKSLKFIINTPFILGVLINISYSEEYDALKVQEDFAKNLHKNSNRESLWKILTFKRIDGVIADKATDI